MGCASSKPDAVLEAPNPAQSPLGHGSDLSGGEAAAEMAETTADHLEVELTEEDFSLSTLAIPNPSASEFTGSSAMTLLRETVDGTKFSISMTAPVEFAMRCFMNQGMHMAKGTDLGDWVSQLMKADMTKLQEVTAVSLHG